MMPAESYRLNWQEIQVPAADRFCLLNQGGRSMYLAPRFYRNRSDTFS